MQTKEQLKQFGTKGQTYQDILQNLMEVAKMHGFLLKQKWILENEEFAPVSRL
ncbi:MAG: hypothetical protein V1728_04435 [Candidatus Micrarchaeota archaeon]